jgi:hypothetical protein
MEHTTGYSVFFYFLCLSTSTRVLFFEFITKPRKFLPLLSFSLLPQRLTALVGDDLLCGIVERVIWQMGYSVFFF